MKINKFTKLDRSEAIVFTQKGNDLLKEAYTRLKDNILYYCVDNVKKVIQVESATQAEGKTTAVANLAIALGVSGKKVVVVDLDFRRPRLHRLFELENANGLGDFMIGQCKKDQMIKKTAYENVDIINRGCEIANEAAVITSKKLASLIDDLRNEYDFILLDCPPVLMISDYIHISRLSDGVLYIAAFGITKKKEVQEGIKLLKANDINIIGCAFTHFNPKKSNNYYEYSKSYYGYE